MDINWLDLLLGGVLIVSLFGALRNGVTKEVVRIVALIFGIVAAMWGYQRLAVEYQPHIPNEQAAQFAAFASILVGCLIAGTIVAWILVKLWGVTGLRWFDRLLGGAFGLVRGLVISTAIVLALVAFAPVASAQRAVAESQLAPWVLHSARLCAMVAPEPLRRAYDEGFERVRGIWSGAPAEEEVAAPEPSPLAADSEPAQ